MCGVWLEREKEGDQQKKSTNVLRIWNHFSHCQFLIGQNRAVVIIILNWDVFELDWGPTKKKTLHRKYCYSPVILFLCTFFFWFLCLDASCISFVVSVLHNAHTKWPWSYKIITKLHNLRSNATGQPVRSVNKIMEKEWTEQQK